MTTGRGAQSLPDLACRVCPYGVTRRCEGGSGSSSVAGDSEGFIGCTDPSRQAFYYDDLHRWENSAEAPKPPPIRPLPAFIPVLVRVLPRSAGLPSSALYGVSLTSVILDGGGVQHKTPEHLRRELGLDPEARVCLIGTGKDERLERMWAESERTGLWHRLADLDFDFTTTTTFSVWDHQPRFDQIYNQERNLYSYSRFTRLGVPVVPFLFHRTPADFAVASGWLQVHAEIEIAAVLAQFYRTTEDFKRLLDAMHRLEEAAGRKLRFLVTGCATAVKLEFLFNQFPRATVVSTQPVMQALRGRATLDDLRHEVASRTISRSELLVQNISRFTQHCAALRPLSSLPA